MKDELQVREEFKKVRRMHRRLCRGGSLSGEMEIDIEPWNAGICYLCLEDSALKEKLLEDPDQFFNEGDVLKRGNTCTVVQFKYGGRGYVLKRYNTKPLSYRMIHFFSKPRALLNWSNAHLLRSFGIATPLPLACLLSRRRGGGRKSYVLMEKVNGEPLSLIVPSQLLADSINMGKQFAELWWRLDSLGVTHGDMKSANFMLNDQGHLILIDLDSLCIHRYNFRKQDKQKKDMRRFIQNWKDFPELVVMFQSWVEKRRRYSS